jgi:PAS domain S-box-containing protein
MNGEDSTREELKVLDNIISELVTFKQQIADSIASEINNRMPTNALRENEKKFREVIENLPQRIFLKDEKLVYKFCNERYARDLKIKSIEIVGKSDFDFFPKELAAKYAADEQRILSTGKAGEIEDRYIISDGERTILSTKIPLKDEMGKVRGILATFWDITERKRVEEEREKYMLRLKELVHERRSQIESLNDRLQKEVAERKRMEEELQMIRSSSEEGGLRDARQIQTAK